MHYGRITLALILLLVSAPVVASDEAATVARTALDAVFARDYEAFTSRSDDAVKAALSAATFEMLAQSLEFQYGSVISIGEPERSASGETLIFVHPVELERATVRMLVAIGAGGKVAGLRIVGLEQKEVWTAPPYANPKSFREEEVTVGAEDFPLPGTLTLPEEGEKFPAVVLLHGSGPHDRDETIAANKPFKDLAWGLASRGIAVLRYEKRTLIHAAKLSNDTVTLESETIDDGVSAVRYLRSRREIDPARIFVAGHSLGVIAAPAVARRAGRLAGLVSIAGPSRPILDLLPEQIEYLAQLKGTAEEEAKKEAERIRALAARLRSGKDAGSETVLGVPLSYWHDVDRRDTAAEAAQLGIPILVVHGGRDYQVPMKCFEGWKRALDGSPEATFRLFESLNHLMMPGEGKPSPDDYQKRGHVDEAVVQAIAEWIGAGSRRDFE